MGSYDVPKFSAPLIAEIFILQLKGRKRKAFGSTRGRVEDNRRVCRGGEVDTVVDKDDGG